MKTSFAVSIVAHLTLLLLLIYSDTFRLEFIKKLRDKKLASSTLQIDLTYKPSDTSMRLGKEKRDLPPPDVAIPKPPPDVPTVKEKKTKKEIQKDKNELKKAQNDMKSILDKLKRESKAEDRPIPKLDNFPVSQQGELGARGTGGKGQRILSPAEQALQAAMRRHFELTQAVIFKKAYPNAEGYIEVSLVALGSSQFTIRSLRILESTGFAILDQSCERAIRAAVGSEVFSRDVVQELSGKDSAIICRP